MKSSVYYFTFLALALGACSRPVARFSYQGDTKAPAVLSFNNESQKAESFEWNFGDGNTSTAASPTHRYLQSGNYTISLKAIDGKKQRMSEQQITINAPEGCLFEIETPFGTMLGRLSDATPQHRDNFIKLAEEGFYDNLLFHRVIKGFMIQGGDPDSRGAAPGVSLGRGGPGYTIPAEFTDSLVHVKGALAAARMGDQVNPEKASSGSQFYIVQGATIQEDVLNRLEAQKNTRYSSQQRNEYTTLGGTPFLDRDYTVFGQIIDGLDVLDKIAATPTAPGDRPREDMWMKIKIIK
jgi:cyclophilin family peptidyl-prolyl cis-trans isomerase